MDNKFRCTHGLSKKACRWCQYLDVRDSYCRYDEIQARKEAMSRIEKSSHVRKDQKEGTVLSDMKLSLYVLANDKRYLSIIYLFCAAPGLSSELFSDWLDIPSFN